MFMPVFTCVLILIAAIAIAGRRNLSRVNKKLSDFQERELAANAVRRQPLDDLEYLHIPDAFFGYPSDDAVHDCHEALHILTGLKDESIVNLTGLTNTDLKERYGPANLPDLSRFDQNYTSMVRALQMYASWLAKEGHDAEAISLLEYSLGTGCDISASYRLLAELYKRNDRSDEISHLKELASSVNSVMRSSILRSLEES
ncbi:MAG: hypothetical protein IK115_06855 [Lachnospiraceae bacterium]|nr:hypothetical protein [Lachnospiraceae bacterium]